MEEKTTLKEKLEVLIPAMHTCCALNDQIDSQIHDFNHRFCRKEGFKFVDDMNIKNVGYTYLGTLLSLQKNIAKIITSINDATE